MRVGQAMGRTGVQRALGQKDGLHKRNRKKRGISLVGSVIELNMSCGTGRLCARVRVGAEVELRWVLVMPSGILSRQEQTGTHSCRERGLSVQHLASCLLLL